MIQEKQFRHSMLRKIWVIIVLIWTAQLQAQAYATSTSALISKCRQNSLASSFGATYDKRQFSDKICFFVPFKISNLFLTLPTFPYVQFCSVYSKGNKVTSPHEARLSMPSFFTYVRLSLFSKWVEDSYTPCQKYLSYSFIFE